jgi:hypothetical protein
MNSVIKKALLYVTGAMHDLADLGFVRWDYLTPKGMAAYDQLKATGYRPEPREVALALSVLKPGIADEELDAVAKLVVGYSKGLIGNGEQQ